MFRLPNLTKKAPVIVVASFVCILLIVYSVPLHTNWYRNILNVDVLFPQGEDGDRIHKQISYIPPNYTDNVGDKIILIFSENTELGVYFIKNGNENFRDCPIQNCRILHNNATEVPDAVLYKMRYYDAKVPYKNRQVSIYFNQESPLHTKIFTRPGIINWTVTYREDSDIPVPYGKWMYFHKTYHNFPTKNYAAHKTKKVAWFVSNCAAKNKRLEYAKELKKFIEVDIFGGCGDKKCPRTTESVCFDQLQHYKFYLSFENSNCVDYITEKFFLNALEHNVIPIVMGAPYIDYERKSPLNSFIHVDQYGGPEELAKYLHKLDKDDNLYNEYFKWKNTGKQIDTKFWCRLCTMLHSPYKNKSYKDINAWWRNKKTCTPYKWTELALYLKK